MRSKHVEAWNKLILKQKFCASSRLITEINILRCTISKTSKTSYCLRVNFTVIWCLKKIYTVEVLLVWFVHLLSTSGFLTKKKLRFPCLFWMLLQHGMLSKTELRDNMKQTPFFTNCSVSTAEDIPNLVQSGDLCYGVLSRPPLELVVGQMKQSTSSHVTYRSFPTTVSQLKTCDFSGEIFKGFEVLQFSMSATMTHLLASGELCELHYDIIPVKSASANVSFYTSNTKTPDFE